MSERIRKDEFRALREESRRHGRRAAEAAPFSASAPPDDLRPLSGLAMPRGLPVEVLTTSEIAAVAEAWRTGWRQAMAEREAAGEAESREPELWWSPAVPGGWEAGWRYRDAGAASESSSGPVRDESLSQASSDESVRAAAAQGGAPAREGLDWDRAKVRRDPKSRSG